MFAPLVVDGVEVVLRREGAAGNLAEVAQSGVKEIEPQMTLRSHTRGETSQIHPTTRIFDWLREVMGLKEADDLLLLEHVVIPRFEKRASCSQESDAVTPSTDGLAQIWHDLAFAARVLQHKTNFISGERDKRRFEAIFEQLAEVVRVPVIGDEQEGFSLMSPSNAFLGETYTDPIKSQIASILFGSASEVLPPPEGMTDDGLSPLLKRIGCFHGTLFEKVELTGSDVDKSGFRNLPYSTWGYQIESATLSKAVLHRLETLDKVARANLFEVLTRLPDNVFAGLNYSTCSYFYYSRKTEHIPGSVAKRQLKRYLLIRSALGTIVPPDHLVTATEQNRQLLAELPDLLTYAPASSLAIMLGVAEGLDWNWFVERSSEWHNKVPAWITTTGLSQRRHSGYRKAKSRTGISPGRTQLRHRLLVDTA